MPINLELGAIRSIGVVNVVLESARWIKMISSKHSFKNGKNQVTKKTSQYGDILNKGKKYLSRENETWRYPYFN